MQNVELFHFNEEKLNRLYREVDNLNLSDDELRHIDELKLHHDGYVSLLPQINNPKLSDIELWQGRYEHFQWLFHAGYFVKIGVFNINSYAELRDMTTSFNCYWTETAEFIDYEFSNFPTRDTTPFDVIMCDGSPIVVCSIGFYSFDLNRHLF